MSLRTELLFAEGSESKYSELGALIFAPPPRREFTDDARGERMHKLQQDFFAMLSLYQIAKTPGQFRGMLGRNVHSLEHALKRCAWLLPRLDRMLSAHAWSLDDVRAAKCPTCPAVTGKLETQSCQFPNCAGADD